MTAIGLDTVVARGSQHVETEMGDQTVMMSIAKGQYYALDQSGQRIWQMIAEPVSAREIVDRLVAEYDVDRERCEADVLAFLGDLQKNGLLAGEPA